MSGSFRAKRNYIGVNHDQRVNDQSNNNDLALELSTGYIAKAGGDFNKITVENKGGVQGENIGSSEPVELLRYNSNSSSSSSDEEFYFKMEGELTVDNEYDDLFKVFADNNGKISANPNSFVLDGPIGSDDFDYQHKRNLKNFDLTTKTISSSNIYRSEREKRNTVIGYTLHADKSSNPITGDYTLSSNVKNHHIAAFNVINPDGYHYCYDFPLYNDKQVEVIFNASGNTVDPSKGLVSYNGTDVSTSNSRGVDNFYQKTEIPAYPYSYPLTRILSPNYVDRLNDGPTNDDLGDYVLFKYDDVQTLGWVTPYSVDKANFSEGLISKDDDNKGSYTYGEKEISYIKVIETKDFIARFTYSDRLDGFGVEPSSSSNTVSIDLTTKRQKLDKIELFSIEEGIYGVPIKTVHFDYDYSLCKYTPNNSDYISNGTSGTNTGKLTLKAVYFTYGKSNKGVINQYTFNYDDQDHDGVEDTYENPNYGYGNSDRWGNYKPNDPNYTANLTGDEPSNAEFPYSEQNETLANRYAYAWNLTDITLPSGGKIQVDYEADRYAYVQDRHAMRMFRVVGFGRKSDPDSNELFSNELYNDDGPNTYLYFELEEAANSSGEVRNKYLKDLLKQSNGQKKVFFKFLVSLNGYNVNTTDKKEYVEGYFELDDDYEEDDIDSFFGLVPGNSSQYGFIKLKNVTTKGDNGRDCNPISKSAWFFIQQNLSELLYEIQLPASVKNKIDNPTIKDAKAIVKELGKKSVVGKIIDLFSSPNGKLLNRKYAKYFFNGFNGTNTDITKGRSWIRLYDPNDEKFGGGSRVKQIKINDAWSELTSVSNDDAWYGQQFYYVTEEGKCSGVAAYEPLLGGEENPFRMSESFSPEHDIAAGGTYYLEQPYGEMYFPSPLVGYSRVVTSSLDRSGVDENLSGVTVNKYYTAKDFPTMAFRTYFNPDNLQNPNSGPGAKITKINMKNYLYASQGFVVETNNMHGRAKSTFIYPESSVNRGSGYPSPPQVVEKQFVSGNEFFYKEKDYTFNIPISGKTITYKGLDNNITTVDKSGNVNEDDKVLGLSYDYSLDVTYGRTKTSGWGVQANVYNFAIGPIPAFVPIPIPSFHDETNVLETMVLTKLIERCAIVDKVVSYDGGAKKEAKNLLWDDETGNILLTSTNNEYYEDLYTMKYPAYWHYPQLGPAYKSINKSFSSLSDLNEGDIVSASSNVICWAIENQGSITLEKKDGNSDPSTSGVVIKPGFQNRNNTYIASISSKNNPIDGNSLKNYGSSDKVYNASAVEYSEDWEGCGCLSTPPYNEFVEGEKGQWTSYKPYVFQAPREYSGLHRHKGYIDGFEPFYIFDNTPEFTQASSTLANWVGVSEVSLLNSNGLPIEEVNIAGNYSAIETGFDGDYVTSKASNSKYSEYFHESFESGASSCSPKIQFDQTCTTSSCSTSTSLLTEEHSHSGYSSIKVEKGKFVSNLNHNSGFSINTTISNGNNLIPNGNFAVNGATSGISKKYDLCYYKNIVPGWNGSWGGPDFVYNNSDKGYLELSVIANYGAQNPTTNGALQEYVYSEFSLSNTQTNLKCCFDQITTICNGGSAKLRIYKKNGAKIDCVPYTNLNQISGTNLIAEKDVSLPSCASTFSNITVDFDFLPSYIDTGKYYLVFLLYETSQASQSEYWGIRNVSLTVGTGNCQNEFLSTNSDPKCKKQFELSGAKKYVVSAWVKDPDPDNSFDYEDCYIELKFQNYPSITTNKFYPSGPVIEGWQRIYAEFDTPLYPGKCQVRLGYESTGNATEAYFDDVRIHPFDANMNGYVYNTTNFNYSATLDANNFATFYEYDLEGKLARVKRETERGIYTINENRYHVHKQ